jgi:Protein of unknown function (DUF3575)
MRIKLLALAVASALATASLHAQAPRPQQTLTINPIGLAAGFYSAELERSVATNISLSVGGSYFSLGDSFDKVSYGAGDLRARFYPGRALEGFSVGVSGGVIRTGERTNYTGYDGPDNGAQDSHKTGVTVGSTIEYAWLLGDAKRIAFSLGGGFKRVILFDGSSPNVTTFYPTLRTSFGVAF